VPRLDAEHLCHTTPTSRGTTSIRAERRAARRGWRMGSTEFAAAGLVEAGSSRMPAAAARRRRGRASWRAGNGRPARLVKRADRCGGGPRWDSPVSCARAGRDNAPGTERSWRPSSGLTRPVSDRVCAPRATMAVTASSRCSRPLRVSVCTASGSTLMLRERLRPCPGGLCEIAHRIAAPPTRPPFFDFTDDERAWDVDDQFMLGPGPLVAPVTPAGTRERPVHLPGGTAWTGPVTGKQHAGGQGLGPRPLSRIPVYVVYVRADADQVVPDTRRSVSRAVSRVLTPQAATASPRGSGWSRSPPRRRSASSGLPGRLRCRRRGSVR
jgi:hypothetical protein